MMPRASSFAVAAVLAVFACGTVCSSRAALIVYEGFDYGPFGLPLFGFGGATEIGFQGTWSNTGDNGATVEYVPEGLTFSDLPVSGGLAYMNCVRTGTGDRRAAASRQLEVDPQFGTLWGSYLFRTSSDLATRRLGAARGAMMPPMHSRFWSVHRECGSFPAIALRFRLLYSSP